MNAAQPITGKQIQRLVILYGQYEAHSLDAPGKSREERMRWASQQTGREIDSFKNLTLDEGKKLIDGLQRALQVKAPSKSPRQRMSRDA